MDNLLPPLQDSEFCSTAHAVHARLHSASSALAAARAASADVRERWSDFEAELLDHLRAEEELLLPAFALSYDADATRLRSEHHQLRALLVAVDGELAAGRLNREALRALEELLARSSAFEERSLFPWAQRCLQPRRRGEFQERTRAQGRHRRRDPRAAR